MTFKLEICAGSLNSAFAAQAGGADRIELCDNLVSGGTTPSFGMVKICHDLLSIPIFPIIRPRGGDFVYSDEEFEVMKQDVICCRDLGCEGLVFGILRQDGSVDKQRCSELISLAGNIECTFHRAFDRCADFSKSLEDVIDLGFHRLLSSGGQLYAEDGISLLADLISQAGNRLRIMPGSGISDSNLIKILKQTGAKEFHSTARNKADRTSRQLSQEWTNPVYLYETDGEQVAKMRRIIDQIQSEL